MKRLQLPVLLGLVLAAGTAWADEDISKVNGRIVAEAGRQYGDLDTVNGGITVKDGVRTGKAETVNGGISVGANAQTGGLSTVNGSISVGARSIVSGGIETVNGSVLVGNGSQVKRGVETVNGSIGLIGTQLGGGIETVNGDITVGVGSHVTGGIQVKKPSFSFSLKPSRKPRIVIGPNAVVEGALDFEREVSLYVHRSARIGAVSGATPQTFDSEVAPGD
ncbi:MAG TPA: hypothetical protein DDZ67_04580 [Xanthomonadaceae bacterium]|nr:hypothetical protein [Xanthomonadaceae bacterium]